MAKWKPEDVLRATSAGARWAEGWTYRHLGLYENTLDEWCVLHLNSGLAVAWVDGGKRTAFKFGAELAECADWSFAAMGEWKHSDPDIPLKVQGIIARSKGKVRRKDMAHETRELAAKVSKEVLTRRAA